LTPKKNSERSLSINNLRQKDRALADDWLNQAITRFDRWSVSAMAMFRQQAENLVEAGVADP
jgi:hypothetical protein